MSRIAALTNHGFTPSSRFRIRQHIHGLAQHDLYVVDHPRRFSTEIAGRLFPEVRIRHNPVKASFAMGLEASNIVESFVRVLQGRSFDATWISREVVNGYPTYERLVGKPLFYDIDDAVFLNPRSAVGVRRLCSAASAIFAGNEYLAAYCRQYNPRVLVVPTAVDTGKYVPVSKPAGGKFVVGWSGTSSSFKYFVPLLPALVRFFRDHPSAHLKICADRFPQELGAIKQYICFEPWDARHEVAQIQSFDIGLMPLEDSEWTRGKCAYKFLLYAACGVPTICSAVGMNAEVLSLGQVGLAAAHASEWHDALEHCLANREILSTLFSDCRRIVVDHFSTEPVTRQIAGAMLDTLQPDWRKKQPDHELNRSVDAHCRVLPREGNAST